jgi:hypothetical protein
MKMTVFWDIWPCSIIEVDRRFRCVYCLHQGERPDDGGKPLKRRSTYTRLHGAISQKALDLIFITSAVSTAS